MHYRRFWIGCITVGILGIASGICFFSSLFAVAPPEIKYITTLSADGKLEIVRRPIPVDYSERVSSFSSWPKHDQPPYKGHDIDVRSRNLSSFDLKNRLADLSFATFDDKTTWPKELPDGFDPAKIMDIGKNPGLGVRALHEKGVTGKGVGIAIIDQSLLVDHIEYKERLKLYEEIHWSETAKEASMHGPAVASIAVGKNVGVAPEADLYFIAQFHCKFVGGETVEKLASVAESINRIVKINSQLNQRNRIRAVSMSLGLGPEMEDYEQVDEAMKKAKEAGIFVIYVGGDNYFGPESVDMKNYPARLFGLGRELLKNPEDPSSYIPNLFTCAQNRIAVYSQNVILVPMDSRCTASPTGNEDYVFYWQGGPSWTIPYIAGLYVLACQVNPDITPAVFWDTLAKTCSITNLNDKSNNCKIINPQKFIEAVMEK